MPAGKVTFGTSFSLSFPPFRSFTAMGVACNPPFSQRIRNHLYANQSKQSAGLRVHVDDTVGGAILEIAIVVLGHINCHPGKCHIRRGPHLELIHRSCRQRQVTAGSPA